MKAKLSTEMNPNRIELQEAVPLRTPLVIYCELSGYCNLKCSFCFQNESDYTKKYFLSFDMAKNMIDQMSEFPDKLKMIRICGFGENLMNKDAGRIIEYMHTKNCAERIVLITNGLLLKHDLSEVLAKNLNHIIISVEGLNSDQYEQFCGHGIDYDKFLEEVKFLHECAQKYDCTICAKIHESALAKDGDKEKFYEIFGNICDEVTIEKLVDLYPEAKLRLEHNEKDFRFENMTEGGGINKRLFAHKYSKGFRFTQTAMCQLVV